MLRRRTVTFSPEAEEAETRLDENSPTVRKFVALLEERILQGHGEASNRSWALTEVGVPAEKFDQLHAMLQKAWTLAGTPADVTKRLRDVSRKRYEYLYQVAVKKEKLKEALHALDAMVKLDGLDQPPEGSVEASIIGGVITNKAREIMGALMNKARDLHEKGIPKAYNLPPGEGSFDLASKTNGTNGAMIIDLREKK